MLLESSHASSLPPGMVMAGAEVAHRFSSGGGQQGGTTTTTGVQFNRHLGMALTRVPIQMDFVHRLTWAT